MRQTNPLLTLVFSLYLCVSLSCKKEQAPTVLPPATQEGKNTAGFRLDGEVWVPYCKCRERLFNGPDRDTDVNAFSLPGSHAPVFSFYFARQGGGKQSNLSVATFGPITHTGNYDSVSVSFDDQSGSYGLSSPAGSPGNSFVITRIDTIHKIISGTFQFTLGDGYTTRRITEGRFDFTYPYAHCTP